MPVIKTYCLPPTFPLACPFLLTPLLQFSFIYFCYTILASFLLIQMQLPCSVQRNMSFLSNQCSVANIPLLLATHLPCHHPQLQEFKAYERLTERIKLAWHNMKHGSLRLGNRNLQKDFETPGKKRTAI